MSRHLQDALAHMLTEPVFVEVVETARATYRGRRTCPITLLREHGAEVLGHDALCIAVRVRSEQQALLVLASHGIAAEPGAAVRVASQPLPFIRLGIGHQSTTRPRSLARSPWSRELSKG